MLQRGSRKDGHILQQTICASIAKHRNERGSHHGQINEQSNHLHVSPYSKAKERNESVMEQDIARVDYEAMHKDLTDIMESLKRSAEATAGIAKKLYASQKSSSIGEQWVKTWGELMTKKDAAKMLGCSPNKLVKIIEDGGIKTAPDGRVLVRSAAEWANNPRTKAKYRVQ